MGWHCRAVALLALGLAACSDDTTGVLLHIRGAAPADQVTVVASTSLGPFAHTVAAPGGDPWTLSFIATFKPDIGDVSFLAETMGAGQLVSACLSPAIAVAPHQVGEAALDCVAGSGGALTPTPNYFDAVAADAPLAWWHLGESDGAAADASGHEQAGTFGDAVARHQPSPLANQQAISDGAAWFPGGASTAELAVRATGASLLPSQALSLELWLRTESATQSAALAQHDFINSKEMPVASYSLALEGGHLMFQVHADASTNESNVVSHTTVEPGQPYHVVGTYDPFSQSMAIYVNGQLDATSASNHGEVVHGSTATSGIGLGGGYNDGAALAFTGTLDEVALYGVALSVERVLQHYLSGATP